MSLVLRPTALKDVVIIEPQVHVDDRGSFMESWNERAFDAAMGAAWRFVQDNHSRSLHGVLRGLHYQVVQPQGKLVRVSAGRVFDVAVDLRRSSPQFGQWAGTELSGENGRQLWVPPGFAHGFPVLSETADYQYKTTAYRAVEHERVLRWDDPALAVQWPLHRLQRAPTMSVRDAAAPGWADCDLFD